MHAYALEILKDNLKEGNRALDVGSGTGYLTACFAIMVLKYIFQTSLIQKKTF
jgi:protein-L-isoaspartate(D-aspartate) O-methyltransferase